MKKQKKLKVSETSKVLADEIRRELAKCKNEEAIQKKIEEEYGINEKFLTDMDDMFKKRKDGNK